MQSSYEISHALQEAKEKVLGRRYERHLQQATNDMRAAEEHLLEAGITVVDQWTHIRMYIQASILRFQLLYAKALQHAIV